MMKNRGFGKFEIFTIIVLILCVSAFLMGNILKLSSLQKIDTMRKNAVVLSKTVMTNLESFHNNRVVYLDEIISQKFMKKIKSPFGTGDCDTSESKVEIIDNKVYVTLKCDDYLIDKALVEDENEIKVYNVGNWSLKKPSGEYQETILYNCMKNNEEIFDDYEEELYMVFKINEVEGTEFYSSNDLSNICVLVNKTFYRQKDLVK